MNQAYLCNTYQFCPDTQESQSWSKYRNNIMLNFQSLRV